MIFATLLALIVVTVAPYGSVEPWWEAFFECVVFALGMLWMVEGALSQGWLREGHIIFLPLILLALYAFIQTLPLTSNTGGESGIQLWQSISADPFETRVSVLKLLALALAGALLLRYTSSRSRLRALIYTIIVISVASAFFGILRQTTQTSAGFFLSHLQPGLGYGQFINRNHFAYLMEMALGLLLGMAVSRGVSRNYIVIYLALALPVWTALVLCNSRGGLFSMLAQVLFLGLLFSIARGRREDAESRESEASLWSRFGRSAIFRLSLCVGLGAVILIGALWIGGEPLTSRLETVSREVSAEIIDESGGSRRREIWRATWQMIKDHSVTGVGLNGYWAAIPQYLNSSGQQTPRQAHNDYLELLASVGVIGAGLAVWFVVLLIKGARRSLNATDPEKRAASLGACTGLFGIGVHSMVDFGLHITANAFILIALVIIAVIDQRRVGA